MKESTTKEEVTGLNKLSTADALYLEVVSLTNGGETQQRPDRAPERYT